MPALSPPILTDVALPLIPTVPTTLPPLRTRTIWSIRPEPPSLPWVQATVAAGLAANA